MSLLSTQLTQVSEEFSTDPSSSSTEVPSPDNEIINEPVISLDDFQQAMAIIKYSVETSMAIIKKSDRQLKKPASAPKKMPIPEPEEITMEYLINNQTHVKNILKDDETRLNEITRMKNYPNQSGGRVPALKFVKGLAANGLGKYSPNSDAFKRYNPNAEICPDRENVKRKWGRLCLE